jgi:hypothetical protein
MITALCNIHTPGVSLSAHHSKHRNIQQLLPKMRDGDHYALKEIDSKGIGTASCLKHHHYNIRNLFACSSFSSAASFIHNGLEMQSSRFEAQEGYLGKGNEEAASLVPHRLQYKYWALKGP